MEDLRCSEKKVGAGRIRTNSWDLLSCLRFLVPSEKEILGLTFSFGPLKTKVWWHCISWLWRRVFLSDKRSTL